MAKKITIPYNGKTYTLEYTREIVKRMEGQGFKLASLEDMPLTTVTALFNNAFSVNHPSTGGTTKEKIYASLKNRRALIQTLMEMYAAAYNSLFDEEEEETDEGNAGWGVME